jgi:hypothetical protein
MVSHAEQPPIAPLDPGALSREQTRLLEGSPNPSFLRTMVQYPDLRRPWLGF